MLIPRPRYHLCSEDVHDDVPSCEIVENCDGLFIDGSRQHLRLWLLIARAPQLLPLQLQFQLPENPFSNALPHPSRLCSLGFPSFFRPMSTRYRGAPTRRQRKMKIGHSSVHILSFPRYQSFTPHPLLIHLQCRPSKTRNVPSRTRSTKGEGGSSEARQRVLGESQKIGGI